MTITSKKAVEDAKKKMAAMEAEVSCCSGYIDSKKGSEV